MDIPVGHGQAARLQGDRGVTSRHLPATMIGPTTRAAPGTSTYRSRHGLTVSGPVHSMAPGLVAVNNRMPRESVPLCSTVSPEDSHRAASQSAPMRSLG